MIGRSRARALALAAALLAGIAYVAPSGAFDAMSVSRSASVAVVTDANAYNALSTLTTPAWTCPYPTIFGTTSECHVGLVTNKGAASQAYRVMRETATGSRMADWALGGVPAESDLSSPWTDWTTAKAVGQSVHIIVNVSGCSVSCGGNTYYANLTIEGKLANVWEYNQTRIMIVMPPS